LNFQCAACFIARWFIDRAPMVSHSMPDDIDSLAPLCRKRYGVSISLCFGGLHK
jgi:hypothetical protein